MSNAKTKAKPATKSAKRKQAKKSKREWSEETVFCLPTLTRKEREELIEFLNDENALWCWRDSDLIVKIRLRATKVRGFLRAKLGMTEMGE